LRATTDYWVNALGGKPFFVINEAVDPRLVKVLSKEIVPRLLQDIPGQPSTQQLEEDRWPHRFTVVFDREGYTGLAPAGWPGSYQGWVAAAQAVPIRQAAAAG
jgi:hypothetical protein